MRTRSSFYDPGDPESPPKRIVPDKDALVILIRNGSHLTVARGRAAQLGATVRVNYSWCVPCSPRGDNPRSRSCELGSQVIVTIRIRQHREFPGHIDAGDEDRLDVVGVTTLAGEGYPRIVMLFRIFFKATLSLNVLPVSWVFRQESSTLISCELERDAGTGFQHPGARVRLCGKRM